MAVLKDRMVRDWWIARRNAVLGSPAFQRFALRCTPLRPVARRHAQALFDLVAGFTYSQTLYACVDLGLFRRLAAGPAAIDLLAAEVELPREALDRLVGAAAALGLIERLAGDRVTLGVRGAALAGNPGVAAMIAHHRLLYADLADPVTLLRRPGGGALAAFWDYAQGGTPAAVADYSALMAASHPPVAEEVLAAYRFGRHRRLLDVGGGEGRFLAAVRAREPALGLGLFDLPAVTARAAARLGGDLSVHPGDFTRDPLPTGYDCISLVRVLHDHDDAVAAALLRTIREVLPPGGTLLIAEPMIGKGAVATVGATYFAFYLLAMGQGRARSAREIRRMLADAGFASSRMIATRLPLTTSLIAATAT